MSDFSLNIEKIIGSACACFEIKLLKYESLLFLLKQQVCCSPFSAFVLNFPGPNSLMSLVSIVRHFFSLELDIS